MRKAGFVLGLALLLALAWVLFRAGPGSDAGRPGGDGDPAHRTPVVPGSTTGGDSDPVEGDQAAPAAVVDLVIVDESGEGVPGARAGVFDHDTDFGFLDAISQARADGDGRLSLSVPARAGDLALRACPPDYRGDLVEVRRELWIPRHETIVLPGAKSVSGVVVAPDGTLVPGASVVWSAGGVDHPGVLADREGRFTLHGLPPGEVTLTALPDDWALTREGGEPRVVEAGQEDVALVLRPDASLIGRIANWPTRQNRRRAYLSVQHPPGVERRWFVWVKDGGSFRIDGLRPQFTYLLWFGALPHVEGRSERRWGGKPSRSDPAPFLADLRTGEVEQRLVIPLGQVIEGRVHRPEGALHSRVWAWNRAFGYSSHGEIEPDGRFLISRLYPGKWVVRAETVYGFGKHQAAGGWTTYERHERYVGSLTANAGEWIELTLERE